MKKNRIIQRTVSAFLAAAMLATLASCDAKLPGSRNNTDGFTNQPRQIMNYYTSEMLTVPEGFGYTDKIFCNDENIYVLGSKSSDSAEIISGIYDFEAKKIIETAYANTVDLIMYFTCVKTSVPAIAGARFVVSLSGDILSPK